MTTETRRIDPSSVDEYIAAFPPAVQTMLLELRRTITLAAPAAAVETISYKIPAFKLSGKPLVYFAAYRDHVSIYPAPRSAPEFEKELARYKGGKGTVQFPLDKRLPLDLVRRIVRYRAGLVAKSKTKGGSE
ncbi:MAG: iron chaperone [Pyrinomonadaceae bacterium]